MTSPYAVFELFLPESLILFILVQIKLGDSNLLFQSHSNPRLRLFEFLFHHGEISHQKSRIFAENLPVYQEELYDQFLQPLGFVLILF